MPDKKKPKTEFENFTDSMKNLLAITREDVEWVIREAARVEFDGYLAFNLSPKQTGLPWMVWMSLGPENTTENDARIWLNDHPNRCVVTVMPEVRVLGSMTMTPEEFADLRRWIELNRETIIDHWTWKIKWSDEAVEAIKHI